jgi:hypothetical protein
MLDMLIPFTPRYNAKGNLAENSWVLDVVENQDTQSKTGVNKIQPPSPE